MATIDAVQIESLVAGINALVSQARLLPEAARASEARATLDALKSSLPTDAGGTGEGSWAALSEETKKATLEKLDTLHTELKIQLSAPGLFGSRMLMSGDPAPSWVILFLLAVTLIGTALVLNAIVDRWDRALQGTGSLTQRQSNFALAKNLAEAASTELQRRQAVQDEASQAVQALKDQPDKAAELAAATAKLDAARRDAEAESRVADERWARAISAENLLAPAQHTVIVMVVLLGALGGLIHLASSLTMFVGNRDLKRSWTVYYLLTPVQGAALAPLLYLLLKSAVLSPQFSDGGGTQNLNLTAIYAFAGLTGLFAKQAIEKLADVFATLFAKIEARDATKDGAQQSK